MPDTSPPPPLLTLRQAARQLGVPMRWLAAQAAEGSIPALRAGNRWLFDRAATADAIAAMARHPHRRNAGEVAP